MLYESSIRSDELYHYGVMGMKWGVRRYQNYDGSYTQKGMQHYRESERNYNEKRAAYKAIKKNPNSTYTDPKSGEKWAITNGNRDAIRKAKNEMKSAKRQLKNDYRQLRRDKAGDKGKRLYESGHTITGNYGQRYAAGVLASVGGTATYYLYNSGNKKYAKYAAIATAGALAVDGVLAAKNAYQDHYLRAYYGHSRPRTNPGRR